MDSKQACQRLHYSVSSINTAYNLSILLSCYNPVSMMRVCQLYCHMSEGRAIGCHCNSIIFSFRFILFHISRYYLYSRKQRNESSFNCEMDFPSNYYFIITKINRTNTFGFHSKQIFFVTEIHNLIHLAIFSTQFSWHNLYGRLLWTLHANEESILFWSIYLHVRREIYYRSYNSFRHD